MIKECTLGDCVEIIIDYRGKTPQKMGGDWADNGHRVISALNVHGGFIDNEDQIRCVSQEIYDKWMKDEIKRNDCFLASEGASLGENAIWDSDEKIVLGQRLYAIRTNSDKLDPWYFAMYMQTKKFRQQIDRISTGSTVFGISQPTLLGVKLLLPSIIEQRKIGALYRNIYRKLKNNNSICSDLESMAKTIYDYWFLQFDFPNEEGKPYKSSGGKMVWNDELKREIPEGWKTIKFGVIADFIKGKIPSLELSDRKDEINTTPYVTIDVANDAKPMYCNPEKLIPLNGETIMVMDGAASGDVYIGNYGILGSTFSKISSNRKDISNPLIYMLLNSNSAAYKKANTGSTVPHANTNFIKQMTIAIPKDCFNVSEQFTTIFKKIENCRKENQELASLRDFLLPLLMNGQVIFKEDDE